MIQLVTRPWEPRCWPSLEKLCALLPMGPILHLGPPLLLSNSRALISPLNALVLTSLTLLIVLIKLKACLNDRREAFKIFDKGKVPSVANKNLFSGNLFEVIVPDHNIKIIDSYHQKLGKTFGMFYGPDPWVFSTDLDLLYRLFVTEGNKFVDMTQFRLPFVTEMNQSLAGVMGDEWRRTRKVLNPSFASKQMKSDNVFLDIEEAGAKFMKCIQGHEIQKSDAHRIVDVAYNFKKYTVEVIFQVAYGRANGVNMEPCGSDKLIDTIHAGSQQIRGPIVWTSIMFEQSQRLLGYLIKFTPISTYISYIHSILDESLRMRRQLAKRRKESLCAHLTSSGAPVTPVVLPQRKMIDTILESYHRNRMNDEKLKANLFFIFIAGFETSANTLAIMFWLFARHQRVQSKLRESLAAGSENSDYLDWCIRETLRLYPAVPTAVGRVLPENIEHKGMTFFKGTTINASIYSIHHSAEYWGQDVEEFRPERFGELKNPHPVQYFAFGHGPRYCLGANLAEAEIKSIVPKLLLKYRVESTPDTPEVLNLTSPNMIHMIIHGRIDLKFIEISSL